MSIIYLPSCRFQVWIPESYQPSCEQHMQEPGTGWWLKAHHLYNQIVMMSVEQITCVTIWLDYQRLPLVASMSLYDMMQGHNGNTKELIGITLLINLIVIYLIYHCIIVFYLYTDMALYNKMQQNFYYFWKWNSYNIILVHLVIYQNSWSKWCSLEQNSCCSCRQAFIYFSRLHQVWKGTGKTAYMESNRLTEHAQSLLGGLKRENPKGKGNCEMKKN